MASKQLNQENVLPASASSVGETAAKSTLTRKVASKVLRTVHPNQMPASSAEAVVMSNAKDVSSAAGTTDRISVSSSAAFASANSASTSASAQDKRREEFEKWQQMKKRYIRTSYLAVASIFISIATQCLLVGRDSDMAVAIDALPSRYILGHSRKSQLSVDFDKASSVLPDAMNSDASSSSSTQLPSAAKDPPSSSNKRKEHRLSSLTGTQVFGKRSRGVQTRCMPV